MKNHNFNSRLIKTVSEQKIENKDSSTKKNCLKQVMQKIRNMPKFAKKLKIKLISGQFLSVFAPGTL